QFVDTFPRTSDKKIHLFPEELDREAGGGLYVYKPEPGTAAHPIALISPSNDRMISSTLGELYDEQFPLELAREDASRRGIADGDAVRVWNEGGEVRCIARVRETLKPGVTALSKGLWRRHTLSGTTANTLAPDTLSDLGAGACFNDARVEVERIPS